MSAQYPYDFEAEKKHWWFQARQEISRHLFFDGLEDKKGLSILSVGTSGAELGFLSRYGNVVGIDVDDEAINNSVEHGFKAVKSDITSCLFGDDAFDVIVAMDILEHVSDHRKACREVMRMLKPGGRFFITVPAFPSLWSAHDEYGQYPHIRRYTLASLLELLKAENATILKASYFNFFFFPLAWVIRKAKVSFENQLSVPHPLVNKLCKAILTSERHWLRHFNFPLGVSLLAIGCKKP